MDMTNKGVQSKQENQALNQQVVIFETEEDEQHRTYDFLWVSEKYFL